MSDSEQVELAPLTPELEGEIDFGGDSPDFRDEKVAGTIAKDPLGELLKDVIEASGHAYKPSALDERFALWLVPHRFAISLSSRWALVTAAGLDVEYDTGGATCSVVQLWPAPQYQLDASLLVHFQGPAVGPANVALRVGSLQINIGEKTDVTFSAGVMRSVVAATGIGSKACSWEFLVGDKLLSGRDIETWSLVALPKRARTLKYRMRAWARHRTAVFATRVESRWVDVSCKLVAHNA